MLNRDDIIERVSLKYYPQNEYWITAGAGLVLHGIKNDTRDIDLGCTSRLADILIGNGAEWCVLKDGTRKIHVDEYIEAFENWYVDDIIYKDGLCVASLSSIRKQKVMLNRPKDRDDIVLIDQFLCSE
jgi:hypothetical protein